MIDTDKFVQMVALITLSIGLTIGVLFIAYLDGGM